MKKSDEAGKDYLAILESLEIISRQIENIGLVLIKIYKLLEQGKDNEKP